MSIRLSRCLVPTKMWMSVILVHATMAERAKMGSMATYACARRAGKARSVKIGVTCAPLANSRATHWPLAPTRLDRSPAHATRDSLGQVSHARMWMNVPSAPTTVWMSRSARTPMGHSHVPVGLATEGKDTCKGVVMSTNASVALTTATGAPVV